MKVRIDEEVLDAVNTVVVLGRRARIPDVLEPVRPAEQCIGRYLESPYGHHTISTLNRITPRIGSAPPHIVIFRPGIVRRWHVPRRDYDIIVELNIATVTGVIVGNVHPGGDRLISLEDTILIQVGVNDIAGEHIVPDQDIVTTEIESARASIIPKIVLNRHVRVFGLGIIVELNALREAPVDDVLL